MKKQIIICSLISLMLAYLAVSNMPIPETLHDSMYEDIVGGFSIAVGLFLGLSCLWFIIEDFFIEVLGFKQF